MQIKKKVFISELMAHVNKEISEPFFAKKIITVSNGKSYQRVILADKSGEVEGKVWSEFLDPKYEEYQEHIVMVKGKIGVYNGQPQITIEKLTPININSVDVDDYSPVCGDLEELKNQLFNYINMVEKKHLQILLKLFFNNNKLLNKFMKTQAGTKTHHACIGGLLKHTVDVTRICLDMANHYQFHEEFDRDILITAALLHDIGKVKEYKPFPINKRTDEGKLLGHLMMGLNMIYAVIRDIEDFPNNDAMKLQHCILTHHGTVDAIIPPMMTEAIILSRADEMDARINAFEKVITEDTNNENFSFYNKTMDLYVYKK
jgi:3'-5' exoribonuclease